MPLCLRPGLSFCRVGDRLIFLDIVADRYFCLSRTAEMAFAQLLGGEGGADPSPLAPLRTSGLLIERAGCHRPRACAAPPLPEPSLLDEALPRAGLLPALAALGDLALSRGRLRLLGLRRTLAALDGRKADLSDYDGDAGARQLRRTVAAFRAANGAISPLDNCLSQSVAIAGRLLHRNVRATLIIGVRLGPFNAHCWVQRDDRLVNDRFDMVRMFTPILAI